MISAIIEGTNEIIDYFKKLSVNIYLTGGETADVAQTKVLNFVDNIHIIKDKMFELSPLLT